MMTRCCHQALRPRSAFPSRRLSSRSLCLCSQNTSAWSAQPSSLPAWLLVRPSSPLPTSPRHSLSRCERVILRLVVTGRSRARQRASERASSPTIGSLHSSRCPTARFIHLNPRISILLCLFHDDLDTTIRSIPTTGKPDSTRIRFIRRLCKQLPLIGKSASEPLHVCSDSAGSLESEHELQHSRMNASFGYIRAQCRCGRRCH